jgi:hypothetical protein
MICCLLLFFLLGFWQYWLAKCPGAGLLGVTIKLDDYGGADERLVRVLEVEEHSPAAGKFMS